MIDPLEKLIGHTSVKTCLRTLLKNPPSTLLFQGPQGVGKKSFALAFAKMLLEDEPLTDSSHLMDLREFFPDGKASVHSMTSIKKLIEDLYISPFKAKRKVLILYEADRMLPSVGNALLKILEKPPSYAHFILVTSFLGFLLKTIQSRAFEVPFFPLSEKEIYNFILQNSTKTTQEASQIARQSQGDLNRAKSLLEGNRASFFSYIHQLGSAFLDRNYPLFCDILKTLEEWMEKEKTIKAEEALFAFYFWHRDLFVLKTTKNPSLLSFHFKEEELKKELNKKLLDLEELQKRMRRIWQGIELHLPFRQIFLELFL